MRESLRLGDAEALEDAEDHERREALGGGREVVCGALAERQHERRLHLRAMPFEILAAHRAAGPREIRGDRARERATVERIESVMREPAQRPSEALVHEPVACRGDRASGKELLREPRNVFELRPLVAGVGVLARGDRHAVLGVVNGVGQEPVERVRAAPALTDRESRLPSRYRARNGVRGQRPPGRDGVEPL